MHACLHACWLSERYFKSMKSCLDSKENLYLMGHKADTIYLDHCVFEKLVWMGRAD